MKATKNDVHFVSVVICEAMEPSGPRFDLHIFQGELISLLLYTPNIQLIPFYPALGSTTLTGPVIVADAINETLATLNYTVEAQLIMRSNQM